MARLPYARCSVQWSVKRKRGQRGAQKNPTNVATTIRIDPGVLEADKATGRGWQTPMHEVLRGGCRV
ncbi:MAG: BrnA antitoxin family protein [Bryobacteraceae bacterium]